MGRSAQKSGTGLAEPTRRPILTRLSKGDATEELPVAHEEFDEVSVSISGLPGSAA